MYVYVDVDVHTPIKKIILDMQMHIYSSYIMSETTVKLRSITCNHPTCNTFVFCWCVLFGYA